MTFRSATLDGLLAQVRDTPQDWDLRRVLADALEEAGYTMQANGQRWQAKHRRCPLNALGDVWYWRVPNPAIPEFANEVPLDILLAMSGSEVERVIHIHGYRETETVLARALEKLDIIVRGDE